MAFLTVPKFVGLMKALFGLTPGSGGSSGGSSFTSGAELSWNGDTGLARNAAGVIEINNGTKGVTSAGVGITIPAPAQASAPVAGNDFTITGSGATDGSSSHASANAGNVLIAPQAGVNGANHSVDGYLKVVAPSANDNSNFIARFFATTTNVLNIKAGGELDMTGPLSIGASALGGAPSINIGTNVTVSSSGVHGWSSSSNAGAGPDTGLSRLGAASVALGTGTAGDFTGSLKLTTLNIASGGSTTISTGVGVIHMSSANPATNAAWIPISYNGTVYYCPGWTNNSP